MDTIGRSSTQNSLIQTKEGKECKNAPIKSKACFYSFDLNNDLTVWVAPESLLGKFNTFSGTL